MIIKCNERHFKYKWLDGQSIFLESNIQHVSFTYNIDYGLALHILGESTAIRSSWGVWLTQSVQRVDLDLQVVSSSPTLNVVT